MNTLGYNQVFVLIEKLQNYLNTYISEFYNLDFQFCKQSSMCFAELYKIEINTNNKTT